MWDKVAKWVWRGYVQCSVVSGTLDWFGLNDRSSQLIGLVVVLKEIGSASWEFMCPLVWELGGCSQEYPN